MSFKKMLGIITIMIVLVFSMMLSTSYAWYTFENASTTFEGVTNNDEILVGYGTSEYISTSIAIPILEEDIDKYSEKNNFFVNVKKSELDTELVVSVSLVDIMIDNALMTEEFKIDLYYQGELLKNISGADIEDKTVEVMELASTLIDNFTDNNFELRVYILDNGMDQSELMNKTFAAKIEVNIISRIQTNVLDEGINSNNKFIINDDINYLNSYDDLSQVRLSLISDSANSMCISVDTSVCSDYIEFNEEYSLDFTNVSNEAKKIYVYYKDIDDKIIAAMSKSIMIDTISPSDNSIVISDGDTLERNLVISSVGADYMCLSNKFIDSSECNNWIPYSSSYDWTLELFLENTYVEVIAYFKDVYGNISEVVSDRVDFKQLGEENAISDSEDIIINDDSLNVDIS